MKRRSLHLGISTCPNDTYLFHALINGRVEVEGVDLRIELLDVQELNERLLAGEFDVAKASYHLALREAERLIALPTGSALGFGNGPLLLARAGLGGAVPDGSSRVLCPGEHTTAALLYRLFHPDGAPARHAVFSEIMPALASDEADFGVCIHEGRFTYEEIALELVEDLGATWETATSTPLPLGGIFARRTLDDDTLDRVQVALERSLDHADEHPQEALETMREHAQELEDEVIWDHVELYVNGWTQRLGPEGQRAIDELARRAAAVGAVPHGTRLSVFLPQRERRLFHIIRVEDAPRSLGGRLAPGTPYAPHSFEAEGFVHLSFPHQLEGTLELHFKDADEVLLLEVRRAAVEGHLRVEVSRDDDAFPHLYRELDLRNDVVDDWRLRRTEAGFVLPEGVRAPEVRESEAL